MKKILLMLSALCVTSTSTLVTSCGINPDPFNYLPSKTAISYNQFITNEPWIKPIAFNFKNNSENKLQIDFSPILAFTIKIGTGSFLGDEKYKAIANQFISEYDYFNWFNQSEDLPTVEYKLKDSDLNTPMVYKVKSNVDGKEKEDSFPMDQVVRIDNYQNDPNGEGSELEFNVTLRKWRFKLKNNEKGIYQATDEKTSLTIFINDLSLKELKEKQEYLEIIS